MREVATDRAPAPVAGAPYVQGLLLDTGLLFVSGQLPLTAEGELVAGGAAEQARRAMANVVAVVEAAGGRRERIVKTTLYVVDLACFGEINSAYAEVLGGHRPARATVGVAQLPLDAMIEIDAIAAL